MQIDRVYDGSSIEAPFRFAGNLLYLSERNGVEMVRTLNCGPYTVNLFAFDRAASVSGSLWFDGFTDYMRSATPPDGLRRIYLSLGDREKNARNRRMAAVEDCTRQAAEFLRAWNIPVVFEMNQGGHFQDIPDRLARGISQLMGSNL